jgi:diguanylate cyclase (GGDEF)-like protein
MGRSVPTEAFTCALLSNVGELGLASVHPEAYSEVLAAVRMNPELDLWALEDDRFAINSREVSMAMMEDWGLPESFSEAVGYQKRIMVENEGAGHRTWELVSVMRLGRTIAKFCAAEEDRQVALWGSMRRVREELELEEEGFQDLCDGISRHWKDWGRELKLPTSDLGRLRDIENRSRMQEAEEALVAPADEEIDPDAFRPLRILAVDDEPVSLRVLASQLRIAGHEVIMARDGEQALALTLDRNPHIVISDWMMPKMDGLELCKALRRAQAGRSVYFLLLTGRDEEDRVVEAFEAGIDDYIAKPFNSKILLARVRAGLRLVNLREQVDREQEIQRGQTAELGVMARKLRRAALTDPLTGLPNRRYGMQRLQEEWIEVERTKHPLSVIMIDIDHFKSINDTHGHDVGDEVLCHVADVMRKVLRAADVISRVGGEEFLVVCPETDELGVEDCAERLRAAVERHLIETDGFTGHVTISLGTGTTDGALEDAFALLKVADAAVYRAKAAGRNCVQTGGTGEEQLSRSA